MKVKKKHVISNWKVKFLVHSKYKYRLESVVEISKRSIRSSYCNCEGHWMVPYFSNVDWLKSKRDIRHIMFYQSTWQS